MVNTVRSLLTKFRECADREDLLSKAGQQSRTSSNIWRRDWTGTPETEVREMMEFYHEITDDPGEVIPPIDPVGGSEEYVETCKQLGTTWFLTTHADAIYSDHVSARDTSNFSLKDRIRQGPPD